MEIKTVSMIGLGSLGILFGSRLLQTMPRESLRIIADRDRIEKYERDGVYCNGERLQFRFVEPVETCGPSDLIIFAVKYTGLGDAIGAVRNHVGENTIILSLLNGISSEAVIGQTYGMEKVLYCVAQAMDPIKSGSRLTYTHMGSLCIGDREPGVVSEKVKAVAEFFDRKKIPYEVCIDMYKRLWGKFMLNTGVNQAVAVFGEKYGDTRVEGRARDVMIAAMREVMALSWKEGINLTEDDLNYWVGVINSVSPDGKPSMRQDVEAGRLSEVDLFAGTVLELGRKHNVPTPVNEMLYNRIKEMESKYKP